MVQQLLTALFALLLVISFANGDIVVLSSGEQLTVEIVGENETHVQVRHAILGDISIDSKDIDSIKGIAKDAQVDENSTSKNPRDARSNRGTHMEPVNKCITWITAWAKRFS